MKRSFLGVITFVMALCSSNLLAQNNVGIGVTPPLKELHVHGTIYSDSAGFMFPDGTIQVSAAISGVNYQNVYTVAKSGGDYTTITAAINACMVAPVPGPNNRYLVRVMPGIYAESITCQKYVTLLGAGKYASVITGTVTGADTCAIDGFFIQGGIICNGTSPFIIHNIITNSDGDGIWVIAPDHTTPAIPWIKENEILDCSGWGIWCQYFGADPWIIANKIQRNSLGGILCHDSSPTISNNYIVENDSYGIYLNGAQGLPAEPTIDDNIIGRTTDLLAMGISTGIHMSGWAEPRIIANDIWLNNTGIDILGSTQPSIIANNINYNNFYGIECGSSGATKPVVIRGNHIHSNATTGVFIWGGAAPIISHNDIIDNGIFDIDYIGPPLGAPMISLNVVDFYNPPGGGAAGLGNYNVDRLGFPNDP